MAPSEVDVLKNFKGYKVYKAVDENLFLFFFAKPVIPTFSLTLTVCYELLALYQSSQMTTSEQTALQLKLVKGYLQTTVTTESLSGLALMNILYEKPVNYNDVVFVDPVFDETQKRLKKS